MRKASRTHERQEKKGQPPNISFCFKKAALLLSFFTDSFKPRFSEVSNNYVDIIWGPRYEDILWARCILTLVVLGVNGELRWELGWASVCKPHLYTFTFLKNNLCSIKLPIWVSIWNWVQGETMQKLHNSYLGPITILDESSDAGQGAWELCPSSPPTHWGLGHSGSVNNCMCCKVSKSEHIHIQNRARAWRSSLIATLLKLFQNIHLYEHYNDCIREQVRCSSLLAVSVNHRPEFRCWLLPLKRWISVLPGQQFCLSFPLPRCFWLDCVQWPPGGNRPLLLCTSLHLWPPDALPRSVHLHANARQFRDRNRYVCYVHGHEIPHLPPTSIPRLITGPGQPVSDHLTLLPPLLWNLCRLLSILHDLGGRPVSAAHPPPLHQRLYRINAPQSQPPQPKWCGRGRREPQQLPH